MKAAALPLLALLLACPAWADPAPRYTVVPLQLFPGTEKMPTVHCEPYALSGKGEAVGMARVRGRDGLAFHAARWDAQGRIHDLGALAPAAGSNAQSINDAGQVVGYVSTPGAQTGHLFLADGGRLRPLRTLPGFPAFLAAGHTLTAFNGGEAVNNAGQILFHAETKPKAMQKIEDMRVGPQAVLYDHGRFRALAPLPHGSWVRAYGLNDAGTVVGASDEWGGVGTEEAVHAFLWRGGKMTDLGVPAGYDDSTAIAANTADQVVGTMQSDAERQGDESTDAVHGFFWQGGKMQTLDPLPGCTYTQPVGINSHGQVVGNSYRLQIDHDLPGGATGISKEGGVFLWQGGQMQDLQKLVPPGWELQSAVAINDRGDILCTGYHAGMPSRALGSGAFLLRPR